MGEPSSRCKWRQLVLGGVCIVSVVVLVIVILHFTSSRKRLCDNPEELLYIDKGTGNGTCYLKNEQGPCGPRSLIVPDVYNFSLGICNCDFRNHNRTLVFHEETNQCYFIFDKGWCEPDEWIVISDTENHEAKCEKNYCRRQDSSTSTWVPKWTKENDNTCVELGSSRDCTVPGETMRFFPGKIYPACNYKPKPVDTSTVSAASLGPSRVTCQPGYVLGLGGRCYPNYDFDF